jgi:PEGA domain-containing protein
MCICQARFVTGAPLFFGYPPPAIVRRSSPNRGRERALVCAAALGLACGPATNAAPAVDPAAARLALEAADGAEVRIDGKVVGTTPFEQPLVLEPGKRYVAVMLDGHEAHAEEVLLEAGKETELSIDLAETGQRTASWVIIGTGLASITTGIALGTVSVIRHRESRDLEDRAGDRPFTPEEQLAHDDAVTARDDFRLGSGIAGGAGLALLVLGGVLFAFDSPAVPVQPRVGISGVGFGGRFW